MVRIKGVVFKKRPYLKQNYTKMICISFLEIEHAIQLGEDTLKITPILSTEALGSWAVGDEIDVEGIIQLIRIITLLGKPSLLPIPVLVVKDINEIFSYLEIN